MIYYKCETEQQQICSNCIQTAILIALRKKRERVDSTYISIIAETLKYTEVTLLKQLIDARNAIALKSIDSTVHVWVSQWPLSLSHLAWLSLAHWLAHSPNSFNSPTYLLYSLTHLLTYLIWVVSLNEFSLSLIKRVWVEREMHLASECKPKRVVENRPEGEHNTTELCLSLTQFYNLNELNQLETKRNEEKDCM